MKLSTTILAVKDVAASVAFYETLGFRRQQAGGALAFMSDGERTLALTKDELVGTLNGKGSVSSPAPAMLLCFMTRTSAEVSETMKKAQAAGAGVVREPAQGAWGGFSGAFVDPDGHVWAVIHNPDLHRG